MDGEKDESSRKYTAKMFSLKKFFGKWMYFQIGLFL